MSNLQLATALPALPLAVADALEAHLADELPVGRLPMPEIGKQFNGWLSRMSFMLGYSRTMLSKEDLFEMAVECAKMVQRRYPALKLSEIDLALRCGGSGEYRRDPDKPVMVSVDTVADWLRCYRDSVRVDALAAGQKLLAAAVPALPPPRVDYAGSVVDLVAQARETCLPVGYELDLGNQVYDWLKSIGAFLHPPHPAEHYADMRAEETDRLLAEHKASKGAERIEYNTFLAALNLGKLPDAHPLSRSVVNACKKRVLREWLIYHAAEETDMPALLGQLINPHQQAA